MTTPKLGGYLPEDIKEKHWKNARVLGALKALHAPDGGLGLGDVDLREHTSPRHSQRALGSCVAQALVKALEIKRIQKEGRSAHVDLSTLHLYYMARELMIPPQTHVDGGTMISLACDALKRFGVCEEKSWPYVESKHHIAPPWFAAREGYLHRIKAFYRITGQGTDRLEGILLHLHAGNPVVFGTGVKSDFFDVGPGDVVQPIGNGVVMGGHAMVIVGYVDGCFIIENSWGTDWGDDGFARFHPDAIAEDWAHDIWAVAEGWESWHKHA